MLRSLLRFLGSYPPLVELQFPVALPGLVGAGGAVYKRLYDTPHRDHYSNYIPGALTN
ncbi:hypothetical protein DSM110093_02228 [Sulfitobacter sp. DSM 110093]|nr:hypothetical protein DSM110093_02228 [Sulfitobacter sp. DSM 110093]